jgi:hypothetical protein
MATAPTFTSALDSFLQRRDAEYSRDMAFANNLLAARTAAQQEDRARAQLQVNTELMQSAEQRARNNQSMTDYRNQLSAPLLYTMAERAKALARNLPRQDALRGARIDVDLRRGLSNSLENYGVERRDTTALNPITGMETRLINGRIFERAKGTLEFRDKLTNETEDAMNTRELLGKQAATAQGNALTTLLSPPAIAAAAGLPVPAAPMGVPSTVPADARRTPRRPIEASPAPIVVTPPIPGMTITPGSSGGFGSPISSNMEDPAQMESLMAQLDQLKRQRPIDYQAVSSLEQEIEAMKNMA